MSYVYNLTKVSDATLSILVNQDVLAFQVSVGNGWFSLSAKDLHMQMGKATGNGQCHPQASRSIKHADLQVIVKRAHLMIVCDQP